MIKYLEYDMSEPDFNLEPQVAWLKIQDVEMFTVKSELMTKYE